MYLAFSFVYVIILLLVSPIVWVAWWLLADLGEKANGSYAAVHPVAIVESRRLAA